MLNWSIGISNSYSMRCYSMRSYAMLMTYNERQPIVEHACHKSKRMLHLKISSTSVSKSATNRTFTVNKKTSNKAESIFTQTPPWVRQLSQSQQRHQQAPQPEFSSRKSLQGFQTECDHQSRPPPSPLWV